MPNSSPLQLNRKRAREMKKLPPWDQVIRGSLVRYFLTCGNKGCRCHRSKQKRHGPYWYVGFSLPAGKRKMVLIPSKHVSRVRRGVAAYKKLWDSLCRISELNLELLRKGG